MLTRTDRHTTATLFAAALLATGVFVTGANGAPAANAGVTPAMPMAAEPADSASLAATTEVPWNPARPLARRTAWEQVVLLPGRIVSLPLVGLGAATNQTLGFLEDKNWIQTGPQASRTKTTRVAILQLPGLGDRTGLGGAVELHTPGTLRGFPALRARYAATLLDYNSTAFGATAGPLGVQYGYDWRPQDQFYGIGNGSSHDSLSNFATQDEFVRATLHGTWGMDSTTARPRLRFDAWAGPRSEVTRTGRDAKELSYQVRFPGLAPTTLDRRFENFLYGASLAGDWRTGHPHWSHGSRARVAFERFDAPVHALELHASPFAAPRFTRYTAETETGVSFMRDPRTVRLLLRASHADVNAGRDAFPFADMARLGGRDGLSGYGAGRFHDLDVALARLSYVFPLARLFELDIHSEWGGVYPDLTNDFRLAGLHQSFGFGLRGRTDRRVWGVAGLDFSPEGIQIRYSVGGVE